MQITITVDLDDEECAAIAAHKECEPDDTGEIKDYLEGALQGAIEDAGPA
jgi:hypothetical protein